MNGPYVDLLVRSLVIPFLAAAVLAYPIYQMLLALRSRQTVSEFVQDHAHKQGTPTMGGLIILAGFLVGCGALVPIAPIKSDDRPEIAIPLLCIGFALIGFLDDFIIPRLLKGKRGLGWTQKLALQVLFAGLSVYLVGHSVGMWQMALTVFLILFFSNAYNFADGMDWLAGMLLLAMIVGYVPLAFAAGAESVTPYLFALFMASLPFLFLNKPKAKVFMGDVGALPIGAVLGLIVSMIGIPSMASAWKGTATAGPIAIWVSLLLVSGMMVAELVPVPLQILSVKLRGKRLFLMTPIHHGYQKRGWKETKVVAAFVLVQVLLSIGGIVVSNLFPAPKETTTAVGYE